MYQTTRYYKETIMHITIYSTNSNQNYSFNNMKSHKNRQKTITTRQTQKSSRHKKGTH